MKSAKQSENLPNAFRRFSERFPKLAEAHEKIACGVDAEGHLDRKTSELIKIGICLSAGLESAMRSHVRRARQAGAGVAETEQTIMLGMNTWGFPATVGAWT